MELALIVGAFCIAWVGGRLLDRVMNHFFSEQPDPGFVELRLRPRRRVSKQRARDIVGSVAQVRRTWKAVQ